MKRQGSPRTQRIYVSLLTATALNASVVAGLKVLREMQDDGFSIKKVATYNALITGSTRMGKLRDAFIAYDTMFSAKIAPDLDTCNAVLKCCAKASQPDRSFHILETMKQSTGVKPNAISYNFAVAACARVGDVNRAFEVSRLMRREGIRLNVVTNNNLLEACSNAGHLERAFIMVKDMIVNQGVRPNSHAWLRLPCWCLLRSQERPATSQSPSQRSSPKFQYA